MEFIIFNLFAFGCGILGSCCGAIFAVFLPYENKKMVQALLGATAGLMLGLISFGLIPEAIELSNLPFCILILILSCILIAQIEKIIDVYANLDKSSYIKSGLLISIGIALHNFPEGLAIGSSFVYDKKFGLVVGLMILIHDVPEGFALAVPFKIAKRNRMKILSYAFLAGVPTGIGCIIGSLIGSLNNFLLSGCIAFAAGAMLYVVMSEIIPEYSKKEDFKISAIASICGIIFSLILLEWL